MTLAGSRGILTVPSLIVHVIWEITSINGVFDIRGMSVQKGEGMIIIDYKDTRPIYEQIVERFRMLIVNGIMEADERLPSVRTLAVELSINPNTIQRAYRELEAEGYVYSMKGKGTFASSTDFIHKSRAQELLTEFDDVVEELFVLDVTKEELGCRMNNLKQGRLDVNG